MRKNKKIENYQGLKGKTPKILYLDYLIYAIFAIVIFSVYSNSYDVPFRYDDIPAIVVNPNVQATEFSLSDIIIKPGTDYGKMRVVPMISFALNFYFGNFDVWGYHFVNIMFHLISTVLLFLLLRLTLLQYGINSDNQKQLKEYTFIAFWGAFIWALSPIHTNSVTYIVQRMNLMGTMFSILCLLCYVKGRMLFSESSEKNSRNNIFAIIFFSGCVISGLMALLSKQNTAMLPVAILLYEWFFFRKLSLKMKHVLIGTGIIVAFVACMTLLCFLRYDTDPIEIIKRGYSVRVFTMWERVMTEWRIIWHYISLLLFPLSSRMQLVYDFPVSSSLLTPWTTLLSLAGILAIIGICIRYAKKYPLLVFCVVWFLVFNIIESTIFGIELIYEHRTYLPSAFVFILVVILMRRYIRNRITLSVILGVISVFCLYNTYKRNEMWRDNLLFWEANYKKAPDQKRVLLNYGNALSDAGRKEEAKNCYLKLLEMDPDNDLAHHNLANILAFNKQYIEAEKHIRKAIEISNDYTAAYVVLGSILRDTGKLDEAMVQFNKALELHPDNPITLTNIGSVYREKDQLDKAAYYFLKALDITPGMTRASLNLGLIYTNTGKLDEAEVIYNNALNYDKYNPELYSRLGLISIKKKNYDSAVLYFQRTLLLDPDFPNVRENIATANSFRGNTDKAVENYKNIIKNKPDDYNAHNNLGLLLLKQADVASAEEHFAEALKIKPDFADALRNIGNIMFIKKRYPQAEYYYLKALKEIPRDPSLHHNLGSVYASQGKLQKAVESYRKAIEIKPDYYEAKKNLERALKNLNK